MGYRGTKAGKEIENGSGQRGEVMHDLRKFAPKKSAGSRTSHYFLISLYFATKKGAFTGMKRRLARRQHLHR
jgi:hypothetical protein